MIVYEWCLEIVDEHGDIIDSLFEDRLCDFQGNKGELCLVRREGSEDEGETDRMWCYVKDGKLSEYFSNELGNVMDYKVPKRFQVEFNKYKLALALKQT